MRFLLASLSGVALLSALASPAFAFGISGPDRFFDNLNKKHEKWWSLFGERQPAYELGPAGIAVIGEVTFRGSDSHNGISVRFEQDADGSCASPQFWMMVDTRSMPSKLTLRVDEYEPITASGPWRTDDDVAFPSFELSSAFVNSMKRGNTLRVRYSYAGRKPDYEEIPLSGSADALARAKALCEKHIENGHPLPGEEEKHAEDYFQ